MYLCAQNALSELTGCLESGKNFKLFRSATWLRHLVLTDLASKSAEKGALYNNAPREL